MYLSVVIPRLIFHQLVLIIFIGKINDLFLDLRKINSYDVEWPAKTQ
jgi:hypothetical protein